MVFWGETLLLWVATTLGSHYHLIRQWRQPFQTEVEKLMPLGVKILLSHWERYFQKCSEIIVISCLFIGIYLLYRVDSLKIISLKYVMYFDHIHLSIPSWSPPFLFPTYTRLLPSPSLLFYFLITSIFIPLPIALHNCVHSRIHKWENVQNLSFLT